METLAVETRMAVMVAVAVAELIIAVMVELHLLDILVAQVGMEPMVEMVEEEWDKLDHKTEVVMVEQTVAMV
jgi:hypothetical protein